MLNGLMAIPALISGLTGGNYMDANDIMRNSGIPPKQYGQTLAMRHRAKRHKPKRTGKRKK